MSNPSLHSKAALRAEMRAVLKAISHAERKAASHTICNRLAEQGIWKSAQVVLLFAPMSSEPDIWPLAKIAVAAGKTVALPRFVPAKQHYEAAIVQDEARDLIEGQFGIREPAATCSVADLKRLDLVLVPGLAFDWHGRRLGRGRGFYDRLLAEVSGKTCGIAFDSQMVNAIPVEPHDVPLNCILTPSHWLEV
jgi:5-formyltetrahydrofolate cyclo-ligase